MGQENFQPKRSRDFWTDRPLVTSGLAFAGVVALLATGFTLALQLDDDAAPEVRTQCIDGSLAEVSSDCPDPEVPVRIQCYGGSLVDEATECPELTTTVKTSAGEGEGTSSIAEDVERATSLDSSLFVAEQSNNLNWSVIDLTPDIAAFGVDGEATGIEGVVFKLGDYSAQTEPPTIEAVFNLGRDYSVLRTLVGLTDNSVEDDPVEIEISDAVGGDVLFSGTVAVGGPWPDGRSRTGREGLVDPEETESTKASRRSLEGGQEVS